MRSLNRRKFRHTERAFLLEGRRLIEDAAEAGACLRSLILRDDVEPDWAERLGLEEPTVHVVAAIVFNAVSEVEHSQGVAAICSMPEPARADQFAGGDLLILDQMRDPGNMGAVLRSAAASGISTVLTASGCVDPYAPKVVRAGMGAHFRLEIGELNPAWAAVLDASTATVVYADMHGEQVYDAFDWTSPFALVLGGETGSRSADLNRLVDVSVRIPMALNVESVNAAVAGSILMFEAARQRRSRVQKR